jgi:hypothetical protein
MASDRRQSAHARHRATLVSEIAILRAMRDGRHLAALLVVLGALALAVPAVALAGGSAGNNQYTNPFGSGTTSQPSTPPPQTSSTAASQTASSTSPPATTVSPATVTTSVVTTSDPTATSEPTATAASPAAGTTTGGEGLPRTGYAVWEIAGFGLVMVAGGFVIRRRGRRA